MSRHLGIAAVGCGLLLSATALASPKPAPTACRATDVQSLVNKFIRAFNAGRQRELDRLVAREPDFEWYGVNRPHGRIGQSSRDRRALGRYFARRHAHAEHLTLTRFKFNRNAASRKPHGNFEFDARRAADDMTTRVVIGKGAAYCYRSSADVIFVWSM
jgi:hypothetical protein